MTEPASGGLRLRTAQYLLLALVVAFAVSCSDSPMTSSPEIRGPLFAIADGGHGTGNPDVFFLEPLTEFDPTNPEFDGMPNPNLMPTARVCELNATESVPYPTEGLHCLSDGDQDDLPMTYDATGGFYRASLKDVDFDFDVESMYRIEIWLATLPLNAYRDIDPDDGPATASCASEDYCQFNATGSAQVPIKVIIENNAACIAQGFNPDEEGAFCATATLNADESLVAYRDDDTVAAATPYSGATLSIQSCTDLRERSNAMEGRIDLMTWGDCVEIDALDAVTISGVTELCNAPSVAADAGLSDEQVERLTIHRHHVKVDEDDADTDDFALAMGHGEASNCSAPAQTQGQAYQFTKMQRFARAVRRTWRTVSSQVSEFVQPAPLNACNRGCATSGDFRTSWMVAGPAAWEYDASHPDGDLGSHEQGTVVTARANVFDSGELEGESTLLPDPYEGLRVAVIFNGVVQSEFVYSDASGDVAYSFPVEAGTNTVIFKAIGVGYVDPSSLVNGVLAPSLNDEDAEPVPLTDADSLTFTAIGTVPFEFRIEPNDATMDDESNTLATLSTVKVCTVGGMFEGASVDEIVAVKNNGSFVNLTIADGSDWDWEENLTDAEGCITFEGGNALQINKTGAYRLIVNPVKDSRGKVVGGDDESAKFNVKPFK